MHLTSVYNIEKSIRRWRRKNIRTIPTNPQELRDCLKNEEWRKHLKINEMERLYVDFIEIDENTVESIIFVDKCLAEKIDKTSLSTIFIDGTFSLIVNLENI